MQQRMQQLAEGASHYAESFYHFIKEQPGKIYHTVTEELPTCYEKGKEYYAKGKEYSKATYNGLIETGNQLYSGTKFIIESPAVQAWAHTTLVETLQGVASTCNPYNVIKVLNRPGTRHVLIEASKANLKFFGEAFLYEGSKIGIKYFFGGHPISEAILDTCAYSYLTNRAMQTFFDNAFNNSSVAKMAAKEEPPSDDYQSCPCGTGKHVKGILASPFYLYLDLKLLEEMQEYAKWRFGGLGYPLRLPLKYLMALRMGHGILEYKLGSQNMCTLHRYDVLVKNNNYAFGMGLSYYANCQFWIWLLSQIGIESYFTSSAIYATTFPFFILAAEMIDEPLPGQTPGFDFFFGNRYTIGNTFSSLTRSLESKLNQPEIQEMILKLKGLVEKFPPYQGLLFLLYGDQVQSDYIETIKQFLDRPSVELYLKSNLDDLRDLVKYITGVRQSFAYNLVYYTQNVTGWLFSPESIKSLNMAFDNKVTIALQNIEELLIKRLEEKEKLEKLEAQKRLAEKTKNQNKIEHKEIINLPQKVQQQPVSLTQLINDNYLAEKEEAKLVNREKGNTKLNADLGHSSSATIEGNDKKIKRSWKKPHLLTSSKTGAKAVPGFFHKEIFQNNKSSFDEEVFLPPKPSH